MELAGDRKGSIKDQYITTGGGQASYEFHPNLRLPGN